MKKRIKLSMAKLESWADVRDELFQRAHKVAWIYFENHPESECCDPHRMRVVSGDDGVRVRGLKPYLRVSAETEGSSYIGTVDIPLDLLAADDYDSRARAWCDTAIKKSKKDREFRELMTLKEFIEKYPGKAKELVAALEKKQ